MGKNEVASLSQIIKNNLLLFFSDILLSWEDVKKMLKLFLFIIIYCLLFIINVFFETKAILLDLGTEFL